MINILSALCAVAVYGRILEMGYRNAAAIIIGTAAGVLAHYAFKYILHDDTKKVRRSGNSERTRKI